MLWDVFCILNSPLQKVLDEFFRKGNPSNALPALSKSSPKFLAIIVNKLENNNDTKKRFITRNIEQIFFYKNDVCFFVKNLIP